MRLAISTLFLIALGTVCAGDDVRTVNDNLFFDGQTFLLAFTNHSPEENVKEYLPKGQTLEKWTELAAVREYPGSNDPKSITRNLIHLLKQQNPLAAYDVMENDRTGEVIVDFITWPNDGAYVEFNIFRYSKRDGGGLVAQQYARREYENTDQFLKELPPMRARLIRSMAVHGLRDVEQQAAKESESRDLGMHLSQPVSISCGAASPSTFDNQNEGQ